jgi:hypothetical protein
MGIRFLFPGYLKMDFLVQSLIMKMESMLATMLIFIEHPLYKKQLLAIHKHSSPLYIS